IARADRLLRGLLETIWHRPRFAAVCGDPEAERFATDAVNAVEMIRIVGIDHHLEGLVEWADLLPGLAGIGRLEQASLVRVVGADTEIDDRGILRVKRHSLTKDMVLEARGDGRRRDVFPDAGYQVRVCRRTSREQKEGERDEQTQLRSHWLSPRRAPDCEC